MPKCTEVIDVQGIKFHLELKQPSKHCEVNSGGRQYRIRIENLRPNSIEVEMESESTDNHVVFGNPGTYTWSDSATVSKQRNNSSTVVRCSETAYPDDPDNIDILESEIKYKDILPWPVQLYPVSDCIEVDVC